LQDYVIPLWVSVTLALG